MSAFGILVVCLMLMPFVALGVGAVMMIRSSYRSQRYIVLMRPWRDMLSRFMDETTMRKVDRIATWLIGGMILGTFAMFVLMAYGIIPMMGL